MRSLDIEATLSQLDHGPAEALESETLEFKSWDSSQHKARVRTIRESVVAMANAKGGVIVLGVHDQQASRAAAIHGVGDLDSDALKRDIYDGTDPHIAVEIEEIPAPEGRLLALSVPVGTAPHTTADGMIRIRVGKESRPLVGSALTDFLSTRSALDPTAELVRDMGLDDLDPEAMLRLRHTIRQESETPRLAQLPDRDLLEALELISGPRVTVAAILLLGRRMTIARVAPNHEVIFLRYTDTTLYDQRQDFRGPLFKTLDDSLDLLGANTAITTVAVDGLRDLEVPDISRWAAREAILNAVVHRNYFLNQSVHVDLYPDRLEITSPGGFPGDVEPGNVLRHRPVRRNPLLALAFQTVGIGNRAGIGVDRIYEEQLRHGKPPPQYQARNDHVLLTLGTETNHHFVKFIDTEIQKGRELILDDLLVLRSLTGTDSLDRWSAGKVLQLAPEQAAERLVSLRHRGYLVPSGRGAGTRYHLATSLSKLWRTTNSVNRTKNADVRKQILRLLAHGSRLTNGKVRELTGFSRAEVLRLLTGLRDEGLARREGVRGGAFWIAGPQLPRPLGGRSLFDP